MTVPGKQERTTLPEPRQPSDKQAAWFTYSATGDQIVWSAALSAMLGRPPAEKEMTRQILARYVHRDDLAKALGSITEAWTSRNTVHTTVRLMRTDGGWFDVDCRLEPMMSPDGTVRGIRGTVRDVTSRERARRESARLTRRGETVQASLVEADPATGLLIRARFADEIDRALRGAGGALLVIRIPVGESGDEGARPEYAADVLSTAARLLEDQTRPEHVLGRVGPNEIAVLFTGISWKAAREQSHALLAALRDQAPAGAWGGLVRFERDAEAGSHGLLIDAEQAWRQSREADRPLTVVAHPVPVRDRQGSYRSRVADALGTDRFTLYSQPILELQSNKVTRHELLLRVLDETDGPQSPIQVLDAAERLDAVFDIDLWVVERAMRLAAEEPGLCLQVNLSGRSVGDPRLTTEVEKLLDRYRVDPAQLTFEITETALIGNLSEARRFADRVRDLGCGLALDDFGSGYASFRYLRLFPIDLVKIDGEYVVDLVDNPQDQVLVRALVQVCQAYGIHTVAEFVQDEATLRMLRELGVDYVQGYLIGRPSPVPPGRLRGA
ncbi:EAL domain-containing protein [Actinoplanes sp. NPDC051861]|uniref:bifunctional diguanylate cyclase/phosphodiesterase n=1 Tax=Actinoplanes sp. NPDC051861 TaxID=3155170 RepID=UPI00341A18BD